MKVIRNSKNIWNHRKFGITLLSEMWSQFFFTFTSNIRFMSFCMEFGKMTLLFIFHLLYNLITSTFCNDRNICSCALFVLAYEAKTKATFFKLWHVSFTLIFTTCLQLHTVLKYHHIIVQTKYLKDYFKKSISMSIFFKKIIISVWSHKF